MIRIPPGISVLVTTISQASFLPLTLGILDHFVLRRYGIHDLPTWVTVASCLLSPLTAFSAQLLLGDLIVYVKARKAGAVLPPHNPTWVPGAIHRILGNLKVEETGYLGNVSAGRYSSYTNSPSKATSLIIRPGSLATPSTSGICSPIASVFPLPPGITKDSNHPLLSRSSHQSRSTSKSVHWYRFSASSADFNTLSSFSQPTLITMRKVSSVISSSH